MIALLLIATQCCATQLEILKQIPLHPSVRKKAEQACQIMQDRLEKTRTGDCITSFQITQQNIPLTITAAGNYCLVEDVVINAGFTFAITINADNVSLDLNGRTIDGQQRNNSGIIVNGKLNTVVANGSIINCNNNGVLLAQTCNFPVLENLLIFRCGNGVRGFGVNSGLFSNLFIPDSTTVSFLINNSVLNNSQNCIVEDCFAVQSNGLGFQLINCLHCIYQRCIAFGNVGIGFLQQNSSQIVYEDCIANDNANHGFSLDGTGIIMENCFANDNSFEGIRITGGFANIQDCQAQSNRIGYDIISARGLTILNSTAHSNVKSGFILEANTRDCELRENTAIINPEFGFQNLGTNNTFYTNFSKSNGTNFSGIANFVVSPAPLAAINFTTNISN